MMDARAAPLEEPSDGAVGSDGGQELHFRLPERERHDGGTVGLLRRMWSEAEDVPVKGERGVEVGHGDADMSDAGAIRHAIPPSDLVETVSNHRRITSWPRRIPRVFTLPTPRSPAKSSRPAAWCSSISGRRGVGRVRSWRRFSISWPGNMPARPRWPRWMSTRTSALPCGSTCGPFP